MELFNYSACPLKCFYTLTDTIYHRLVDTVQPLFFVDFTHIPHIPHGYFTGTGEMLWLPRQQRKMAKYTYKVAVSDDEMTTTDEWNNNDATQNYIYIYILSYSVTIRAQYSLDLHPVLCMCCIYGIYMVFSCRKYTIVFSITESFLVLQLTLCSNYHHLIYVLVCCLISCLN